ncbi:MAG: DNA polymerase IV [Butyricicoccus sp.]
MDRCILHVDCNCFYASVEMLYHPETRNHPMAVGGDAQARHGIILAKNDPAKRCGVSTGEALWLAYQKCPDLLVLPPNFPRYLDFSRRVKRILACYTDQIESFGIDEAWLDVTGSISLFGSGEEIAHKIRRRIQEELGITVSVGVSWNKIFAKLGSDLKKPNAVSVITPDNFRQMIWPLPANYLLGVGRATQKRLSRLGIQTIGELAQTPHELLAKQLGKAGDALWAYANGIEHSPVAQNDARGPVKSISNSTTTARDINTPEDAKLVLTVLAESVCARLREQNLLCRTVSVSLRTTALHRSEFQHTLPHPSDETQFILHAALELFQEHFQWDCALRSLGIQLTGLSSASEPVQLDLFSDPVRYNQLDRAVDRVRQRFGTSSVLRASVLLDPVLTGFDPKTDHVIHPVGFHTTQGGFAG